MLLAQATECTDVGVPATDPSARILRWVNNRNLGQMIGILLLVVAAAFGGYVLGSGEGEQVNTPGTAGDVRSEPASSDISENSSGESADADRDASQTYESKSGLPLVFVDELPDEAIDTLLLIESDGPYPYNKDGSTFQNREGLLPDEYRGFYREFTVDTPGSSDRGARRIVGGEGGELYYTSDHYSSFSEIADW